MKTIRVLQFPVTNTKGGITRYVLNLWKYIDRSVIQMDFLTFSNQLDFEDELLSGGSKVFHFSCYPEDDMEQFTREFKAIVFCNNYDVFELHTSFWKSTIMEELAKSAGIKKIIIHAHSTGILLSNIKESKVNAELRHYNIRNNLPPDLATDYWTCSKEAGKWLFGDNIKNVKLIHNAIDVKKFSYKPNVRLDLRNNMKLNDKFVIGHVGRLESEKNHKYIFDIFESIYKINKNARLMLIGIGSLYEELMGAIRARNLSDAVIYLGAREDVERWYQVMDVFVLPSLFEAAPISLIEAQCTGLKCVCSEFVPDEAIMTDNVFKVNLKNKNMWIEKIQVYEKGYDRKSQISAITEHGYNIFDQILKIQQEYMRK